MADHNQLKDKLTATSRYRRLIDLRREVQSSRGSIPFSVYADLENRIDEKIRGFDYPACGKTKITILFSNGLAMELDSDECVSAMKSDMRLSSYIFSKYPSAVDFNIENDVLVGTYSRSNAGSSNASEKSEKTPLHTPGYNNDVQERVDHLMDKVDQLEKMYNETIPKISKGMEELKSKMDFLYKKLIEEKP